MNISLYYLFKILLNFESCINTPNLNKTLKNAHSINVAITLLEGFLSSKGINFKTNYI